MSLDAERLNLPKLITRAEAQELMGLSKTAFYTARKQPSFPRPCNVSASHSWYGHRYVLQEVLAWIQARISARDSIAAKPTTKRRTIPTAARADRVKATASGERM